MKELTFYCAPSNLFGNCDPHKQLTNARVISVDTKVSVERIMSAYMHENIKINWRSGLSSVFGVADVGIPDPGIMYKLRIQDKEIDLLELAKKHQLKFNAVGETLIENEEGCCFLMQRFSDQANQFAGEANYYILKETFLVEPFVQMKAVYRAPNERLYDFKELRPVSFLLKKECSFPAPTIPVNKVSNMHNHNQFFESRYEYFKFNGEDRFATYSFEPTIFQERVSKARVRSYKNYEAGVPSVGGLGDLAGIDAQVNPINDNYPQFEGGGREDLNFGINGAARIQNYYDDAEGFFDRNNYMRIFRDGGGERFYSNVVCDNQDLQDFPGGYGEPSLSPKYKNEFIQCQSNGALSQRFPDSRKVMDGDLLDVDLKTRKASIYHGGIEFESYFCDYDRRYDFLGRWHSSDESLEQDNTYHYYLEGIDDKACLCMTPNENVYQDKMLGVMITRRVYREDYYQKQLHLAFNLDDTSVVDRTAFPEQEVTSRIQKLKDDLFQSLDPGQKKLKITEAEYIDEAWDRGVYRVGSAHRGDFLPRKNRLVIDIL